jgi:hypothetical protein
MFLTSERPIFVERDELDYNGARNSRLAERKQVEAVTQELVQYCLGLTLWGHPRTPQKWSFFLSRYLIDVLLFSLYNPNLAWEEYRQRVGP